MARVAVESAPAGDASPGSAPPASSSRRRVSVDVPAFAAVPPAFDGQVDVGGVDLHVTVVESAAIGRFQVLVAPPEAPRHLIPNVPPPQAPAPGQESMPVAEQLARAVRAAADGSGTFFVGDRGSAPQAAEQAFDAAVSLGVALGGGGLPEPAIAAGAPDSPPAAERLLVELCVGDLFVSVTHHERTNRFTLDIRAPDGSAHHIAGLAAPQNMRNASRGSVARHLANAVASSSSEGGGYECEGQASAPGVAPAASRRGSASAAPAPAPAAAPEDVPAAAAAAAASDAAAAAAEAEAPPKLAVRSENGDDGNPPRARRLSVAVPALPMEGQIYATDRDLDDYLVAVRVFWTEQTGRFHLLLRDSATGRDLVVPNLRTPAELAQVSRTTVAKKLAASLELRPATDGSRVFVAGDGRESMRLAEAGISFLEQGAEGEAAKPVPKPFWRRASFFSSGQ